MTICIFKIVLFVILIVLDCAISSVQDTYVVILFYLIGTHLLKCTVYGKLTLYELFILSFIPDNHRKF